MLQCNLLFVRPVIAKALDWEPGVLAGFSALLLTYSDLLPKHFTFFASISPKCTKAKYSQKGFQSLLLKKTDQEVQWRQCNLMDIPGNCLYYYS